MALVICGCTSTETTAARLQLNDSRLRAESEAVHVTAGRTSTAVTVAAKTFIAVGATFEVAVTLKNDTRQAVSDLPISVGYQLGSRTVYLNGAAGLSYFQNHVPSIAARGSLIWVDRGGKKLPRGARTFVRVGPKPEISLGHFTPPVIRVAAAVAQPSPTKTKPGIASTTGQTLKISLTNTSSIPQYEMPVYAVVTRRGRIVAASSGSITDLGGGAKAVIQLSELLPQVVGGDTSIRVQAPATIFK